jgi:TadE-like protein
MRPTGPARRASRLAAEGGHHATVPTVPDRRAGRLAAEGGQATVELVALLPVIAVLVAGAWQAALAGHAVWGANAAARAAARAHAVGADPRVAARSHLPRGLERGLRVSAEQGGDVRISVPIPALPGLPSPGRAAAAAHFEPQS